MKTALTFASALVYANASTVITTDNECWNGDGGEYVEPCSDVYFFTCDVYEIRESCNVFTFSDSRITWYSAEISVHYWTYYLSGNVPADTEFDASDFGDADDEESNCYAISSVPTKYSNGDIMNYTGGMCGFKYQFDNSNANGFSSEVKVMKDSATTLLAGSALAIAAVLSF